MNLVDRRFWYPRVVPTQPDRHTAATARGRNWLRFAIHPRAVRSNIGARPLFAERSHLKAPLPTLERLQSKDRLHELAPEA